MNNTPVKVLLADDDADDRSAFEEALAETKAPFKLTTVENGEKLMKYLASANGEGPDIIFLDINMPCKNGKECLKEIRSNREMDAVPVVMFSTSSYKEDIEETFAQGANLFVSKPAFFADQIKILKKIFELYGQQALLNTEKEKFVLYFQQL